MHVARMENFYCTCTSVVVSDLFVRTETHPLIPSRLSIKVQNWVHHYFDLSNLLITMYVRGRSMWIGLAVNAALLSFSSTHPSKCVSFNSQSQLPRGFQGTGQVGTKGGWGGVWWPGVG